MDHMAIVERLSKDSKIQKTEPYCWEWNGRVMNNGYGQVWFGDKEYLVHRLAAHAFFGFKLDSSYVIMHKCDNRICWNPEHIISTTTAVNNRDMGDKGRVKNQNSDITHCANGHEFTPENTRITQKLVRGVYKDRRVCKTCDREAQRRYKEYQISKRKI